MLGLFSESLYCRTRLDSAMGLPHFIYLKRPASNGTAKMSPVQTNCRLSTFHRAISTWLAFFRSMVLKKVFWNDVGGGCIWNSMPRSSKRLFCNDSRKMEHSWSPELFQKGLTGYLTLAFYALLGTSRRDTLFFRALDFFRDKGGGRELLSRALCLLLSSPYLKGLIQMLIILARSQLDKYVQHNGRRGKKGEAEFEVDLKCHS